MENASKALVIAGSVLIAIMIVALGVTIFNKAQGAADTTSLDTTEITMFNSKFERYAKTQQGSQVKTLISFCISNASINKDDPSLLPKVVYDSKIASNEDDYITNLGIIRGLITSTTMYTVNIEYNSSTGLISTITIE